MKDMSRKVFPLQFAPPEHIAAYRTALVHLDEVLSILPHGSYRNSLVPTVEWMRKELLARDARTAPATPSPDPA